MITAHDFKVGDLVQPKNTADDFAGRKGIVKAVGAEGKIAVYWFIHHRAAWSGVWPENARFLVSLSAR